MRKIRTLAKIGAGIALGATIGYNIGKMEASLSQVDEEEINMDVWKGKDRDITMFKQKAENISRKITDAIEEGDSQEDDPFAEKDLKTVRTKIDHELSDSPAMDSIITIELTDRERLNVMDHANSHITPMEGENEDGT